MHAVILDAYENIMLSLDQAFHGVISHPASISLSMQVGEPPALDMAKNTNLTPAWEVSLMYLATSSPPEIIAFRHDDEVHQFFLFSFSWRDFDVVNHGFSFRYQDIFRTGGYAAVEVQYIRHRGP